MQACSLQLRFNFIQQSWVPDQSVWDLIIPSVERWHSLEILVPNETALYTTLAHLEPFEAYLLEQRMKVAFIYTPSNIRLGSALAALAAAFMEEHRDYRHCI